MSSDLIEETVAEAAAFLGPIAVPHFLPNRAPGLTDALHAVRINSSFAPHSSQNEASAVLSWLQHGQAAHRVSRDPDYDHALRGRRKERSTLRASRERSINVLGSSSIALSYQVGSRHRWVLSPSYERSTVSPSL